MSALRVGPRRRYGRFGRLAGVPLVAMLVGFSSLACATATTDAGYLYASPTEAIFVRWSGVEAETGSVEWRLAPDQRRSGAFTVERAEGGFSFVFEPGTLAGWTGRSDGDGLVLTLPDGDGSLRTLAFRPATTTVFEEAAADLH